LVLRAQPLEEELHLGPRVREGGPGEVVRGAGPDGHEQPQVDEPPDVRRLPEERVVVPLRLDVLPRQRRRRAAQTLRPALRRDAQDEGDEDRQSDCTHCPGWKTFALRASSRATGYEWDAAPRGATPVMNRRGRARPGSRTTGARHGLECAIG